MFKFIQDSEEAWYICPADKVGEAYEAFDALEDWYGDDSTDDPPGLPDYLIEIEDPSYISFTDYSLDFPQTIL